MTKTDLKNNLRLQLSEDMREFAVINNLTEQDVIKIRDNKLIPEPHLGFLTALLKDKNLEFYKEDKLLKKICGITEDALRIAAEDLENEKFYE